MNHQNASSKMILYFNANIKTEKQHHVIFQDSLEEDNWNLSNCSSERLEPLFLPCFVVTASQVLRPSNLQQKSLAVVLRLRIDVSSFMIPWSNFCKNWWTNQPLKRSKEVEQTDAPLARASEKRALEFGWIVARAKISGYGTKQSSLIFLQLKKTEKPWNDVYRMYYIAYTQL